MTRSRAFALSVPAAFAGAAAIGLLALRARPSASFAWLVIAAAVLGALVVALERAVSAVVRPAPDEPARAGGRRLREIQREKALTLRSLKELDFDFKMGKLADADFSQMAAALRERAVRLMREIDAAARAAVPEPASGATARAACASCGTHNDADADFCKRCGSRL